MAISTDGDRFGSASKYVIVSDPIILSYSLPRIMAPNDSIELPVKVFNQVGVKAKISVKLSLEGPVRIKGNRVQEVLLPQKGQQELIYYITALSNIGKAVFRFDAEGGNETASSSAELAVRPARTIETLYKYGEIAPYQEKKFSIPEGYLPTGQKLRLSASPREIVRFLGAMEYLIHYPYGCSEQTASSAFPLLYFQDLADMTGYFNKQSVTTGYYIQEAIKKLEDMALPNGEFSIWPGGNDYFHYNSLYVSHFLLEASRMGFEVNPGVISACKKLIGLNAPENRARLDRRNMNETESIGNDPYILYLRALIGEPDRESMDYLRLNKLNELNYVDRCRLASSYALSGDKNNALSVLPSSYLLKYFPRSTGGDYDSIVKRLSIYLMAICDINPDDPRKMELAIEIEKNVNNGYFGTTHDNVLALIALSRALEKSNSRDINAGLFLNNTPLIDINPGQNVFEATNLSGKTLSLTNRSGNSLFYNLYTEGIPREVFVKPQNQGLEIKRQYLDKTGKPLNLTGVVQGELAVVTITVKTIKPLDNLVIVDLLPAGFEIENPRLNSRGQLNWTPPYNWKGAYEDIRDDRLLLFTGALNGEYSYSYTVRAVTPGEYIIPQVYAEAMYDPEVFAVGEKQGKLNVVRNSR